MVIRTSLAVFIAWTAFAADPVELPAPQTSGGKPLMQALKERKSSREFAARKLTPQVMSNLLWAAYGINRPDGRRTAPSASNRQSVDIYVTSPDGAYRYDPKAHRLDPVAPDDLRSLTGSQGFVKEAAINLVYVGQMNKFGNTADEQKLIYASAEVGSISQNVYLYCASEGLATVVRALMDRGPLAKALALSAEQRVILAQSVGYPK